MFAVAELFLSHFSQHLTDFVLFALADAKFNKNIHILKSTSRNEY